MMFCDACQYQRTERFAPRFFPHPQRKIDAGIRVSSVAGVIGPADPKASESGEVSVIADFAADTLVPRESNRSTGNPAPAPR